MQHFTYRANPAHVVFGTGTLSRLAQEIESLGIKSAVFLSTPEQSDQVAKIATPLGALNAGLFDGARMHTPTDVSEQALRFLKSRGADGIVAIGGGSTVGLGKALALRTNLPLLVVPTTYAGSEMTPILGETADGVKRTMTSDKVLPSAVIYDVALTMTLPVQMAGLSGMNAIAHAVEALYARDANPIISLLALEAIAALSDALPRIAAQPDDADARSKALYGAWLCGTCLGSVGMALHHKLCHTVAGSYDLPHAQTHSIILPHALAYNAPVIPEVMTKLRDVLGTDDPAQKLYDIGKSVGAPDGLRDIGMPDGQSEAVVTRVLENPYWNPRPLEHAPLVGLIERAWSGAPPGQ